MKKISGKTTKIKWDTPVENSDLHSSMPAQLQMAATWLFSKSFIAECNVLWNIWHQNLVKTLTCCSSMDYNSNEFKALVFEFMVNGSLEKWLHPYIDNENQSRHLNLLQRLNVAIDIASA